MNIEFKSNSKDWRHASLFTPNSAIFGTWYNTKTLQILRYTPDEYIIFEFPTLDDFKKELKISVRIGLLLEIYIKTGNPFNSQMDRFSVFKSDLEQECVRLFGKRLDEEKKWGRLSQYKLDGIWRMLHQAYHAYCIKRSAFWEVEEQPPQRYIPMPVDYDPARLTSWGPK